jgi:hypothetical protein
MPNKYQQLQQEFDREEDRQIATRILFSILTKDTRLPEIAQALGMEQAMELMGSFGGSRVYFPQVFELPRVLNQAGAALRVLRGRMTERKAIAAYGVTKGKLRHSLRRFTRFFKQVGPDTEKTISSGRS